MSKALEETVSRGLLTTRPSAPPPEGSEPEYITAVGEGRFRIQRRIGEGGMGTVYRAHDQLTGLPVAVKIVTNGNPSDIARFLREAQVLSKINEPAVVRYLAHGDAPLPYLVMEWLHGHDLAEHLKRKRPSIADSVALIRCVAGAMASVHTRGIVHRDLKPSNLFLVDGRLDQVKIIDFGIARMLHATHALTAHNALIGTPEYMAPEQVRASQEVDVRSDIFSLGCVLFECLTGRRPFTADSLMAVFAKLLHEETPRLSELCPGAPSSLVELVDRMLCKDPKGRPANAAALAAELDRLDLEASAPRSSGPISLTEDEDSLISVLMVGGDEYRATSPDAQDNVEHDEGKADLAENNINLVVTNAAARHNGGVDCLIDGNLVVIFHADGIATDHAQRAARCALEVHSRAPRHPLALVMGWHHAGKPSPMGALLDRASALLRSSQGAPRIDSLTAGLLDRDFEVDSGNKGCTLKGELPLAGEGRKVLGKEVPFVGRERELSLLRGMLEATDRGARVMLVTGAPGSGKSRLRHELVQWSHGHAQPSKTWVARGNPMRAAAPFGLLGDIIRQAANIHTGEPLDVRRQKLQTRVARNVSAAHAARVAMFLGELVGTPFPGEQGDELSAARVDMARMADQLRRAWVEFLEAECRVNPVTIILDDLQWGDPATVEYVDVALRLLKRQPLFVLALARPEVSARFPDLWRARGPMQIFLDGLSRTACQELCQHLLGQDEPAQVAERLWERSEGNPFLLEELLRAHGAGSTDDLPETALAVVQSRLASLDPESRRLLRAASVLGRTFWRGGVSHLLGAGTSIAEVDARLDALEEREWILRNIVSSRTGEVEYAFLHDAMRDAAYAMLAEHDRRLGHALAASWLESRGETDAVLLAQHFDAANMPAQAAFQFRRAGERAVAQWAHQEAIVHLSRALDLVALIPESPERARLELDLQVAIAVPLAPALGYSAPEVRRAFTRAQELCLQVGAVQPTFATLCGLWRASLWGSKLDSTMELGEQLLGLALTTSDPTMELVAHRCIGAASFYMGRYDQSLEHNQRVLGMRGNTAVVQGANQFEIVDSVVGSLSYAAWLEVMSGRPDSAARLGEEAIAMAREMKHAFSITFSLSFATWLHQFRQDAGRTRENATEALRACNELGHQMWLAWNRVPLGWASCAEGRISEGVRLIEEGIEECQSSKSSLGISYFFTLLAEARLLTGSLDAAAAALDEAERLSIQSSERFYVPEMHRVRALVCHAAGARDDAALALSRAREAARFPVCPLFLERAARTAARLGLEGPLEEVSSNAASEV